MTLTKVRNIGLLIIALLLNGALYSSAQFYSSIACASASTINSSTGASEGCSAGTYFFDEDPNSTSWIWDFGDGTVPETTRNPLHFYASAGTYLVTLTTTGSSGTSVVNKSITVGSLPMEPKFNGVTVADTTVCDNQPLKLSPYTLNLAPNSYTYLWYPGGETTKTIEVDSSGCYSVEVFSADGCSRTASINVKFCYQQSAGGGGVEKWFFGNGATLEFQNEEVPGTSDSTAKLEPEGGLFEEASIDSVETVPVSYGTNPLVSEVATAMVYGPSGELAFYSDGKNIYNGQDELILDASGNGLSGTSSKASQGLSIVPKNACNECPHHQYYVFSTDVSTGIMSYSIIDLRYNEGKGIITERDVPVAIGVTERSTVISKADETGFTLFTHQKDTNELNVINLDTSGVQSQPQNIGTPQDDPASQTGYTVFDDSGTTLAQGIVIGGQNFVEIMQYNEMTGLLSAPMIIDLGYAAPSSVYGLAFNEAGDILYVTLRGDPALGETSYLLQVPLLDSDPAVIALQIVEIASSSTEEFGALKLSPSNPSSITGRSIYMTVNGKGKIARIQDPDQIGAANVGYIAVINGVDISGTTALGLPTVVKAAEIQDGGGVSASYNGNCFNATTVLSSEGICDPMRNEITWEFEDGTTLKGKSVNYTFPKLGWNNIKMIIDVYAPSLLSSTISSGVLGTLAQATEKECTQLIVIDSIYIKPSPVSNLADTAYLCTRPTLTPALLDPAVTGGDEFTYSWGTAISVSLGEGAGDPIQEVNAPSVYTLAVENNFSCSTTDEIQVLEGCVPEVQFPTAFTPTGQNPRLKIWYTNLDDPILKIYNRWGEIVFETNNLDITWDGRYKNQIQTPTVYPYVLTYRALDFPEKGLIKEVGSVWILK